MAPSNRSWANTSSRHQRGQIVVEYVLLLVIGVALAFLITTQMVSRSESSPGFLVKKWVAIISAIGADPADDVSDGAP